MSRYEARVYTALIGCESPLSGYEVAKRANVPRSMVYQTLAKLVDAGTVFEVDGEKGNAYLALPPDSLLHRLERDFSTSTSLLAGALPKVIAAPRASVLHHLDGRNTVLERARDLAGSSSNELYLALWDQELRELNSGIREAEERDVSLFILRFGATEGSVPHAFPHRHLSSSAVNQEPTSRLLIVASDRKDVLIGGATTSEMWAMYCDNPAVALVATEYVRHDIALQQLAERIGVHRMRSIWQEDPELKRLLSPEEDPGVGPGIDGSTAD